MSEPQKYQPLQGITENVDMPWGGYDRSKKTLAVLACDDSGNGVVLWSVGAHIQMEQQEVGLNYLEELGIYPPEGGVWIWEGRGIWREGPYEYPLDGEMELVGAMRRPTAEEWEAIQRHECPWNDDDWLDVRFKDQILAERAREEWALVE